jgi:tetratricopeptide (TPR) repeat protein
MRLLQQKFGILLAFLLLFLMLFSAYSNTFSSPPVLDDFHSFVDAPQLQVKTWSPGVLKSMSQTVFGWSRWIPLLTFSWDIWYGEGELFYLHLTNYCIHLSCLLAIFFLVYEIAKCTRIHYSTKEPIPQIWVLAFWVAGLWVLHPLQTNAVTYLVQRMASLMTLFYVLAIAGYVAGRSLHLQASRLNFKIVCFYSIASLSTLLAFLSKENAAMIPVMLLTTEAWFFDHSVFQRIAGFARKHWVWSLGIVVVALILAAPFLQQIIAGYQTRHFTLGQRLLTQPRIIIWYISLLLFPHPGRLSLEHDIELSTSLLQPLSTLFSIVCLIAVLFWAISQRKKLPIVTYGIVWFFLNILMESSFISLELVFEHRMYLPSVGIILSLVAAAYSLCHVQFSGHSGREFMRLGWCAFAILAAGLTLATFERNQAWSDAITLNTDNVLKAPKNPRAHANLAVALSRSQQNEEAIREAEKAINLGQKYFEQYCVAANTIIQSYRALSKNETAVSEGERLVKERPDGSDARAWPAMSLNIAAAYLAMGNPERAHQTVREALIHNSQLSSAEPFFVDKAIGLLRSVLTEAKIKGIDLDFSESFGANDQSMEARIAETLIELKYRKEAKQFLEASFAKGAEDKKSSSLLHALMEEERLDAIQQSKREFTTKYVHRPFSRFNACMAVAFLIQKKHLSSPFIKIGEGLLDYAVKLREDSADAHLLKGWYHYERSEYQEAEAAAKRALELDPAYARAWLGLGFFMVKANQPAEAVVAFQKALELYPGSPERQVILDILASLKTNDSTDALTALPSGAKAIQPGISYREHSRIPKKSLLLTEHTNRP